MRLVTFRAIGKTPPQAWYERPIFYHPSRFSACGPDAEVPWPGYTERLDFELEVEAIGVLRNKVVK